MCSNRWMDIETAPKDGTGILGWWPHWTAFPVRIWWQHNQWNMAEDQPAYWYDGMPRDHGPTHWMPLPEPPGSNAAMRPVSVKEAAEVILGDRWGGYSNSKARMAMFRFVHDEYGRHMIPASGYDGVFQAGLRALARSDKEGE